MSGSGRLVRRSTRAVAAVVVGCVVASCGLVDVDRGSITAMVGAVRADQAPLGQYFSFDRHAAGTGVDLDGPAGDVLAEVFSTRAADPTVGRPLAASLDSAWPERIVFDIFAVDATYEQPGTSGPTLMRGRFDGDLWPGTGLTSDTSLAMSGDEMVALPQSMSASEVLVEDQDRICRCSTTRAAAAGRSRWR